MNVGDGEQVLIVEPIEDPVPREEPDELVPPEREPDEVPA
jgi:hypothetical protein